MTNAAIKYERTRLPRGLRAKAAVLAFSPIVAERCRRKLFHFEKTFWPEISQDEPKWNWHIEYLCEQLEEIARRVAAKEPKKHDLIINVPPGTTKSITCSIMFPVWCWINWPWMRFIVASYAGALSLEHAQYSRDLVRSSRFRRIFPEMDIKQDKDTKSNFGVVTLEFDDDGKVINTINGGNRFSTSVGGTLTGFHGHILIVDDPLDPNRAVSEVELKSANNWFDQTLSTRKVDKENTPTIVIMQRLHQNDPTGHLLAKKKKNVLHISLPGEIRNYREYVKPPELVSRYIDGLLDPGRMPWPVLEDMRADLGQYGFAGQFGQNPVPPGGGMFKVGHWERWAIIDQMPADVNLMVCARYWDKAGTEDAGAYTAGVKMYRLANGKYLVADAKRGQWSSEIRESVIKTTAETDGPNVVVYHEQEPGSGGKDSAQATTRNLAGFSVHADRPTGNKVYRADPYSVQVNDGNVLLLRGEWNHDFIEEHRFFPFGTYKDQVDAASGAFSKLVVKKHVKPVY